MKITMCSSAEGVPRIEPLKPEELNAEALEIVGKMRGALGLTPTNEIPNSVAVMMRHSRLYASYAAVSRQLMNGLLASRDRELAILRNAWICQAPFEWGEHVAIGKRLAGLTSEEIDRVIKGSAAPGWSDHERAVLRAVEELHERAALSDETWCALADSLSEPQLIELLVLIGQFTLVAFVQNGLRIPLRPGNSGLSAR